MLYTYSSQHQRSSCNVPPNVAKLVLDDVFGHQLGTVFEEGLVDALNNDNIQLKVDYILAKWHDLPVFSSADVERFIQWFVTNTVETNTLLWGTREDCGLGSSLNFSPQMQVKA